MTAVENAFIERFGSYAGWAHNILFISDLASSREYLPESLQASRPSTGSKAKRKKSPAGKEDIATPALEDVVRVPDTVPDNTTTNQGI